MLTAVTWCVRHAVREGPRGAMRLTLAVAMMLGARVAGASVPSQAVDSTSPAGVVRQLVAQHLASGAGFDSVSVRAKRRWLSDALAERFGTYFRKPVSPDEVPELDGDPFTDSQDTPTSFTVGRSRVVSGRTRVPVHFSNGVRRYTVTYVLRREHGRWTVADIRDRQGTSLLRMLR